MLTSVPALRGAGLDELADSIEATARELGLRREADVAAVPRDEIQAEGAIERPSRETEAPAASLATRVRHSLGGAIVVALAGAGRLTGLLGRSRQAVRHSVIRRRELIWAVAAAGSMSLLLGWVISRLS
jgi:hypothetical protein